MAYRITGLPAGPFLPLYGLSDAELAASGVQRMVVDAAPGFPDRVGLCDVPVGERVLLLNWVHQPAATAYRASHAIFVREGAEVAFDDCDVVPEVMRRRMLSLRAFDAAGEMRDAALVDGQVAEAAIGQLLDDPVTQYIQAHYAVRGCYAARIERSGAMREGAGDGLR